MLRRCAGVYLLSPWVYISDSFVNYLFVCYNIVEICESFVIYYVIRYCDVILMLYTKLLYNIYKLCNSYTKLYDTYWRKNINNIIIAKYIIFIMYVIIISLKPGIVHLESQTVNDIRFRSVRLDWFSSVPLNSAFHSRKL